MIRPGFLVQVARDASRLGMRSRGGGAEGGARTTLHEFLAAAGLSHQLATFQRERLRV